MDDRDAGMVVRPIREDEVPAVITLWHETKLDAYPYLPLEQSRTIEQDSWFFRERILPGSSVWLAVRDGVIAGFLALQGSYIDRLYVHPSRQGQGAGSALMAKAKELSPTGLELHTHQQNEQARRFYERREFRAVRFGISPPPESAPDVEYHWRPSTTGGAATLPD
jgi:ribosomal protein S18 acetylase RimI-like enzyme